MTDAPLPLAAPALTRPSVIRVTEALLVGAGLLLLVIAGLLAFLPVPPNAWGTCGPDFGSAPAVSVVADPDQVLDWQPARRVSERALRAECLTDARYRVGTAVVLAAGGVLVGACAGAVEGVWRRGRAVPPSVPGLP